MAKNPADRFATAGELATATAAALAGATATPCAGSQTRDWTTPPVSYPTTPPPAPPMYPRRPEPSLPTTPLGQQFPGRTVSATGPASFRTRTCRVPAPRRRKRGLIAAALALTVAAVATAVTVSVVGHHRGGGLAPYQPQTLNGWFGAVQLDHRPLAIAALGPGDPDAVLSFGVQPAVMGGIPGKLTQLASVPGAFVLHSTGGRRSGGGCGRQTRPDHRHRRSRQSHLRQTGGHRAHVDPPGRERPRLDLAGTTDVDRQALGRAIRRKH